MLRQDSKILRLAIFDDTEDHILLKELHGGRYWEQGVICLQKIEDNSKNFKLETYNIPRDYSLHDNVCGFDGAIFAIDIKKEWQERILRHLNFINSRKNHSRYEHDAPIPILLLSTKPDEHKRENEFLNDNNIISFQFDGGELQTGIKKGFVTRILDELSQNYEINYLNQLQREINERKEYEDKINREKEEKNIKSSQYSYGTLFANATVVAIIGFGACTLMRLRR